jgi:hypothetical protein
MDKEYEDFKQSLPPMPADEYEQVIKEWIEKHKI